MEEPSRVSRTFSDSAAVEITGKIMVIAILVLFLVVAFVLLLQLYANWFWSRIEHATPARQTNRLVFAPAQDTSLGKGLDPVVLRSLPVLAFRAEDFKDGLECAVCLSELVQGEKARLLPKCNHGFHVDCIDMWFHSHATCPLCRSPVTQECSNSAGSQITEDIEAQGENLASGVSSESRVFPTNVLVWGNQTQVTTGGASSDEGSSSQRPSPSSSSSPADGFLAIDIPNESSSSALSSLPSRFVDEEQKSPVPTRLRSSLKRILGRDRKASPCSPPDSIDAGQS